MDKTLELVLKKLEEIEKRLKKIEGGKFVEEKKEEGDKRDLLFGQALKIIERYEEVPASLLAKELKIDQKRAEAILDQLAAFGYGEVFWGEA